MIAALWVFGVCLAVVLVVTLVRVEMGSKRINWPHFDRSQPGVVALWTGTWLWMVCRSSSLMDGKTLWSYSFSVSNTRNR